jgi:predicted dehydrogenase
MNQNRRDFVKSTSIIAGGLLATPFLSEASIFNNGVDDTIKIALIGCGGRGTGAIVQALSTKQNVKLVAMADAFKDRLDSCYAEITSDEQAFLKPKIAVKEEHKFTGFDGYLKAMALADVVILTTPPGFRPMHFEAAVNAGKHIFMEKPCATDPAGVQRVLNKIFDSFSLFNYLTIKHLCS